MQCEQMVGGRLLSLAGVALLNVVRQCPNEAMRGKRICSFCAKQARKGNTHTPKQRGRK